MVSGSVLILDEVDLGDTPMMCLQPILEGRPIFLKKIGRIVHPANGFNVIATANTKGKGSDDGRFIGTNVLNEAFLERFSITLEQEYPSPKIEAKILNNVLAAGQVEDTDFSDKLTQWADVIRKSFLEGAVSDVISTRRLVHICEAYAIFGRDREKAISLCLNRFDHDTRASFLDLYKKLDETLAPKAPAAAPEVSKEEADTKQEIPF
jgi:MoxR-like ATPase